MNSIQSVDRAIGLLSVIAASTQAPTVRELAKACGLNRSTAWRLLSTLERHAFVVRDEVSQRYTIGYGVTRIAGAASDHAALIRQARPSLERLAADTGETINLSVVSRNKAVCIDQIDPPRVVFIDWVGKPLPLHCTSSGKAMLACLSDAELRAFFQRPLEALTPATITQPARLWADIKRSRKRGYAVTRDELEDGLCGVSAAVRDQDRRAIAFVSVSSPIHRVSDHRLGALGRLVVRAADEIGDRLQPAAAGSAQRSRIQERR